MEARLANPAFELPGAKPALEMNEQKPPLDKAAHKPGTVELFVQLKITDNEAQTIENALRHRGLDVHIRKWTHYEIEHAPGDQATLAQALIQSGELLNLNKEKGDTVLDGQAFPKQAQSSYVLVRDKEDSVGVSKTLRLQHLLGASIQKVHHGVLWEISGAAQLEAVLATNIFANHHAQNQLSF